MKTPAKTPSIESVIKVLNTLTVIAPHFVHGLSPTEIAKTARISPANVTRHVVTLIEAGYAERIEETGRIRPSHLLARIGLAVMNEIDKQSRRSQETHRRFNTPL